MSDTVFNDPPHVDLLRSLSRGALKQNLSRAIRLWAWLHLLYGDGSQRHLHHPIHHPLDEPFSWADCRATFFSTSHPKGEQVPELHDPECICTKTVESWLFQGPVELHEPEWRQTIYQYTAIATPTLNKLLKQRLFGVTRRSLAADLQTLAAMGWLHKENHQYRRVAQFPIYPAMESSSPYKPRLYEFEFLQPDLAAIVENLARAIQGKQRFFLHTDYVVPQAVLDRVEDWHTLLRQVWEETPVPPLQVQYASARQQQVITEVIYPVCVYYAQRAIYLCGFNPALPMGWYNYRLDRIQTMKRLKWSATQVPRKLKHHYQRQSLPTPDEIQLHMSEAWGFDFYLPAQLLLLRFERLFHDAYVRDTFRHDTFEAISYRQAQQLIQQQALPSQQLQLLQSLDTRSPDDAYYQVMCRVGDTNIQHRLRAWRPHCEVLLPWEVRQKMVQEVATEFQFYHS